MGRKLLVLVLLVFLLTGAVAEEQKREPTFFEKVLKLLQSVQCILSGKATPSEWNQVTGETPTTEIPKAHRNALIRANPPWPDKNNRIEMI